MAQSLQPFQLTVWEEKLENFPCTDCHEKSSRSGKKGGKGKEEEPTEHVRFKVNHGQLKCLHCHDDEDRDLLTTVDGRKVSFSKMEEMCSGCHSRDYHDWEKGSHGKLIGFWEGVQWRLRCVECHYAHLPKMFLVKPENPPEPPPKSPSWSFGGVP